MWAQKYGPIFYLQLGPQNLIALNSADVADQLLVSRSKTYSSRPRVHVAQDIMSNGQRLGFLPYGDEFKVHTGVPLPYDIMNIFLRLGCQEVIATISWLGAV